MPDGTPRRIVSNNKLKKLGWKSKTTLASGILNIQFFKKSNLIFIRIFYKYSFFSLRAF